ncbi:MAG: hypothetical protein JRI90_13325, partial [Deltaproteobacteria bacterium]|nr:hypothetical protein [Deltaproteobacteria bacterium]
TIFGASSTIGIIGLGYARGLTGAWWSLMGGIALIPFALFLASRVRASNAYTLPDILKKAYGEKVSMPAGIVIAVAWCGVIAAQLVAGGRLVAGLFSVDFQVALFAVAVVFTAYTFWGGQLSVIRTDFWQFMFFGAGFLIALAFLLLSLSSTPVPWWKNIPVGHWRFPVSSSFGWYDVLVYYPLIVGLAAKKAALNAAVIVMPLSFLLALFGLLARAKFHGIPADAALPKVLAACIPTGLKGLVAVGFLSAIMSSADTCLISASTILALNVFRPVYGGNTGQYLKVTRWGVVLLGTISWLIASQEQGIISSLLLGYTVFVGGIVMPILGTFFQERLRITPKAAFWAVIIGGGTAIAGKVSGGLAMKTLLTGHGQVFLREVLGPQYMSIFPILLSVSVLLLISRINRT